MIPLYFRAVCPSSESECSVMGVKALVANMFGLYRRSWDNKYIIYQDMVPYATADDPRYV